MGDSTPATTNTSSSSSPWSAATPLLQSLISRYGSMSTDVTNHQTGALGDLWNSASGMPNFGQMASGGVNKLFNSDTSPQVGMLGQGYDTLKANLGNTASGAELNPYSTPGFSDAIDTMGNDITNRVKGVYAGSGREPAGAGSFGQSLGRGLAQGEAPVIASQFNANKGNQMDAAKSLFSGAGSTATGEAGLGQLPMTNILQGLSGAGMLPSIYTGPAATQLSAANAAYMQPLQNLQGVLTPALGLGALGTNTTGTSTQTPANNPMMNILGGLSAGAGMLGSLGSAGGSAGLAGLLALSDERLKEDIEPVGKLNDGQNVYSYRYKGHPTPQLGLLAQEVLEHEPEAVHDVGGGVLAVDYSMATRRARVPRAGMLDMKEAA